MQNKPIIDFAKQHGLFLIEDAAEAHGAKVDGQLVGSFGVAASFSFYGNKIITTGEGGMVTTNDHELAVRMRILRGQGMDPRRRYWFTMIGFNYRMTNLAAALGCAQLERIDRLIQARKRVANCYIKNLEPVRLDYDIQWLEDLPGLDQVSWLFSLRVPKERRDALIDFLSGMGIDTRPFFIPCHTLPMYSDVRFHGNRSLDSALILGSTGISLPTYSRLTEEDVLHISRAIIQFMRQAS